jgi:hypothetical protein
MQPPELKPKPCPFQKSKINPLYLISQFLTLKIRGDRMKGDKMKNKKRIVLIFLVFSFFSFFSTLFPVEKKGHLEEGINKEVLRASLLLEICLEEIEAKRSEWELNPAQIRFYDDVQEALRRMEQILHVVDLTNQQTWFIFQARKVLEDCPRFEKIGQEYERKFQ